MPVLGKDVLYTTAAAAAATCATTSQKLPANTLIIVTVANRNATPAYLAHPTLTGLTFEEVDSVTMGGTATQRLTVFRALTASDNTLVITAVGNGIAQDWVVTVAIGGGTTTGGSNGANAVGQVVHGDSGASAVTSLTLNFPSPFAKPTHGGFSAFLSAVTGGMTPNWQECSDISGAGGQLETQFYAENVTFARATAPSGRMCGIAFELITPASSVVPAILDEQNTAGFPEPHNDTFGLIADKVNLLLVTLGQTSNAGQTYGVSIDYGVPGQGLGAAAHQIADTDVGGGIGGIRMLLFQMDVPVTGPYTVHIARNGFPAGSSTSYMTAQLIVLDNADLRVNGNGIVQIATQVSSSSGLTSTAFGGLGSISNRDNTMLAMFTYYPRNGMTPEVGWQTLSSNDNNIYAQRIMWRANADQTPSVSNNTAFNSCGFALELAAEPVGYCGCTPDPTPPTIVNITPAPGALPTVGSTIEFDVIDEAPGLRLVELTATLAGTRLAKSDGTLLTADAPTVTIHDGFAFQPPFDAAPNARTATEGGWHFVLAFPGGWPGNITLRVNALDQLGAMEGAAPP